MSLLLRSRHFPAYCRSIHCCSSKLYRHNEQNLDGVEQAGPLAARLASRSVISFRGPDTVKFLQGLLTNDVKRFETAPQDEKAATLATPKLPLHAAPPMYAALLTPEGRFLYDLFLYRPCRSDEKFDRSGSSPGPRSDEPFTLLADVDAYVVDEIFDCLKRYRLRAKVEIDDLSKEFSCWQQFGKGISGRNYLGVEPEASSVGYGGTVDHAGVTAAQGNHFGWPWYKDPRLDSLGFRGLFPSDIIPPLVEAEKQSNDEHYLLWRLAKGVAEGTKEIPKGQAIPLEYNFTALNAISFDKGCYVGQEFIARTHHRGVIRKRLLPLKFVDENSNEVVGKVAPGSEVINIKSGKKAGTVTTAVGYRGMGVLRLEEALNESHQLSIQGHEDVNVKILVPDWWPKEWTKPKEQASLAS